MLRQYHIKRADNGPDYHPLTAMEVIELLETAIALKDHRDFHPEKTGREIASIQMRLGQGIPGSYHPLELATPEVQQRTSELDELFVAWIQNPDTLFFKEQPLTERGEIVVQLMELMR